MASPSWETPRAAPFDIGEAQALELLHQPNPHGKPNSDIVVPWANGLDVTRRPRDMWIVDYGAGMSEQDAALYEKPYDHIKAHVKPERENEQPGELPPPVVAACGSAT